MDITEVKGGDTYDKVTYDKVHDNYLSKGID